MITLYTLMIKYKYIDHLRKIVRVFEILNIE